VTPTRKANPSVLDRELPADVARGAGRALGVEPPATLGDWLDAVAGLVGNERAALCTTDAARDEARVDGEVHSLRCVLDGLVLAHLRDRRVVVRSESRGSGETVTLRAGESVTTEPAGAVLSFGVGNVAEPTDAYGSFCPYIDSFPSLAAYERWAQGSEGATVPLSPSAGHELAGAIAGRMTVAEGN
jgi:hypothetical protein